jgi:hypothetical protein
MVTVLAQRASTVDPVALEVIPIMIWSVPVSRILSVCIENCCCLAKPLGTLTGTLSSRKRLLRSRGHGRQEARER